MHPYTVSHLQVPCDWITSVLLTQLECSSTGSFWDGPSVRPSVHPQILSTSSLKLHLRFWWNFNTSVITEYVPKFVHGIKKIGSEGGLWGLPPKIGICFLLRNYTCNSDETWPQPSSPVTYQSLFMALKKNRGLGRSTEGVYSGLSPQRDIYFLLRNDTHNSDETWLQPSSPMVYQSLLMTLEKLGSIGA